MKVRIKKLNKDAVIPKYAHDTDACFDLTPVWSGFDDNNNIVYGTGLAFEIPEGYVGLVFPRSSVCNYDLIMHNSVGIIDSGYRGEVKVKFFQTTYGKAYRAGERVAQMMIIPRPHIEFEEVDELTDTDRGEGGYGSTGK